MIVRNAVRKASETRPAKRPKRSVRYYYVVKAALSETQKRISDTRAYCLKTQRAPALRACALSRLQTVLETR